MRLVRARLRLLRLFAGAGWLPALAVSASYLVMALLPPLTAVATGRFVGMLAGGAPDHEVLGGIGLLIGLALATRIAEVVRDLLGVVLARRIDGAVRERLRTLARTPRHVVHLERSDFHDDAVRASDPGHGIGRIRSPGTAAVGQVVLVFRFVSALAGAALLATFSVWLAGILLVASLVIRVRLRRQWIRLVAVKDADAAGQRRLAYLSELAGLAGAKELRVYGLGHWLLRRRLGLAYQVHGPTWREMWRVLRSQKLAIGLGTGSVALAMAVPAFAAVAGRIGSEQLVTAVAAAWTIFAISSMGSEAFDIEYGLGGVRALDRLTTRYGTAPVTVREPGPATAPGEAEPRLVRFENVSFRYPDGPPVLDGLSLVLRPGERVAVVGRNGAGKTTLIKLLAGLYPPTSGRITVDGRDLAELDPAGWRRELTVVFQDYLRYPATVAENVAMSAPEWLTDRAGVAEAVRRAGAAELVTGLADGLDTSLWREGTAGTELSGGQWQRIAIARALFAAAHGRRLLVLDEPTAHLDVAAEAAFYRRVVAQVPRATVLLISHRLSTVRPADRIVLLRDGVVAEEGSHDELMASGGEYRRLFTLQAARFADVAPAARVGE
ncbi:ABC transporter ATP-binding protein [Plantactinospora sp. CA-294935]|uniref:ABC transporter ATP-binding protein n=1 Tax=Plantactinospora sp. CA-294935 TaxID=3240012 RepID=UPI003D8D2E29